MINVDKTLLATLNQKFGELRYQGKNNSKEFRAILSLIIVHDLLEWSVELGTKETVIQKLKELENFLLLHNSSFNIEYTFDDDPYVNVNTPQNIDTWKRVWDSKDSIQIPHYQKYIPCTTEECSPARVYEVGLGTVKDFFVHQIDTPDNWIKVELGTLKNLI